MKPPMIAGAILSAWYPDTLASDSFQVNTAIILFLSTLASKGKNVNEEES
jgi:hypothetical protein